MQIKFNNVSYSYNAKSKFRVDALKNINVDLSENKIIAIAGKTGSGKSTLVQLINKLLTPISGKVYIDDLINSDDIKIKGKDIHNFRRKIGFLFQFSEYQLFADSVIKDVMFGIKNFYPKGTDYEALAIEAMKTVGLDESFFYRSPFDLSGGEKKKVAIAGVLAYKPRVLILDEPTAGLDAVAKKEMMDLFRKIHETGVAIILVTHDMDVVLKYADKMLIINDGKIITYGNPQTILKDEVEQYNLKTPEIYRFANELISKGMNIDVNNVFDIPSLIMEIKKNG